ncbi:hypothetical protein WA026_005639 [Henosepilachna vigintioctopunctata]|uniref:Uncharacterized protein n=1 Tax=Henosepilachna vigintioctopunctata TaxID=420089 RepID=A0AAW1U1J9_9CUCU
MMFVQVILFYTLMVISISMAAPQSSSLKELAVPELQPPPVTYSQTQSNVSSNIRSKRCGGGGGCHQPAPSKTYHISITVQKAPAPKPKPVMRHPAPVAVVPVAVVPVVYAQPMSYCCGGGGGGGRRGGGGGKKWHKGK